jgi:hypothetical protein
MPVHHILRTAGTWIVVAIVIVICIGLYVQVGGESMPDNAWVYLDDENRTYLAPSCISSSESQGFKRSTIAEARSLSYEPEAKCRDTGAFDPGWYSLLHYTLIKAGIFKPIPSHWNPDGSWNRI